MRLRPAVAARADGGVHVEAVVGDELVEVARAVRDEPDLEAVLAQELEGGQGIVVQAEVVRALPAALDLDRALARAGAVAAHPAHDPLRERVPDLLVVLELGVLLQRLQCLDARLLVERRIEVEPVLLAGVAVRLGTELRPGPGDREVDVEENGFQEQSGAEDSLRRRGHLRRRTRRRPDPAGVPEP